MRDDVQALIRKLAARKDPEWLAIIADVRLGEPAAADPDAAFVLRPYHWLIARIGDGLTLTKAGKLPPAVVRQCVDELGWGDRGVGAQNREDNQLEVRELRESAQALGLVRLNRGRLFTTKAAQQCANDSERLWWHIASRLPLGRQQHELDGGLLYLLVTAAGRGADGSLMAEGLGQLGWMRNRYEPLDEWDGYRASSDTRHLFRMLGVVPDSLTLAGEQPPTQAAIALARAVLVGQKAQSPQAFSAKDVDAVELHLTLKHVRPDVWRELIVPTSLTLHELHDIIQIAMGWEDCHLHQFIVNGKRYSSGEEWEEFADGNDGELTLSAAIAATDVLEYEYDFGDSWDHEIRVVRRTTLPAPGTLHLLAGKGACPPEDCGGAGGYQELLEAVADPTHERHQELIGWLDKSFDPQVFDVDAANHQLEILDCCTRQLGLPAGAPLNEP